MSKAFCFSTSDPKTQAVNTARMTTNFPIGFIIIRISRHLSLLSLP